LLIVCCLNAGESECAELDSAAVQSTGELMSHNHIPTERVIIVDRPYVRHTETRDMTHEL